MLVTVTALAAFPLVTTGTASAQAQSVDEKTGAVFVGDALGVHLPDVGVLRPATPPPPTTAAETACRTVARNWAPR